MAVINQARPESRPFMNLDRQSDAAPLVKIIQSFILMQNKKGIE